MKKTIYIVSLLSAFVFHSSFAQKNNRTNKEYNKLSYVRTTENLLKLAERGNRTPEVLQNLANAFYFNGEMEEASTWYKELMFLNQELDSETYFRYAQSLRALENYDEADNIMKKFSTINPQDSRAKAFVTTPNYLEIIEKLSSTFELTNLELNTKYSDFGASFYNSGIYLASSRGEGRIYNWNEQPFLDIYSNTAGAGTSNVYKIKGDVNTRYHESSTAFSKDGNTMYFTRNNYYRGKFKKNSQDTHSLKIYKASLVNEKWKNITSLPFNNDEYTVAHPALNADETKLYFTSDMPGTLGASDIFVAAINEDGSYGEPKNLGPKINTEGRENFPFVSDNGTLYFSSDAHQGLGGLDVFKFENIDSIASSNNVVYNVGKPINSPKDDFAYIVNETTLEGYVSSNRPGGKGDDDIYSFKKTCSQQVTGTVINKETKQVLSKAKVVIYNSNKKEVNTIITDKNGAFNITLPCQEQLYKAIVTKAHYQQDTQDFTTGTNTVLKLSLKPEAVAEVDTDLFTMLELNPIYFNYIKSYIRPDAKFELVKIIDYMNTYPTVKVNVKSHTDSRGKDSYNVALSKRRNKETINYIIYNGGIARERLTGDGYGETKLVNRCSNGVKCSDVEHQANRRSEFSIIEN